MSIILGMNFKIALGMIAGRANHGRGGAHDYVAAVAAFLHLDLALFKHIGHLDGFEQRAITLLVMLLDRGDQPEAMASSLKSSASAVFAKPSLLYMLRILLADIFILGLSTVNRANAKIFSKAYVRKKAPPATLSEGGAGNVHYPLMEPIITPLTKYFCRNGYTHTMGITTTIIVAMRSDSAV